MVQRIRNFAIPNIEIAISRIALSAKIVERTVWLIFFLCVEGDEVEC